MAADVRVAVQVGAPVPHHTLADYAPARPVARGARVLSPNHFTHFTDQQVPPTLRYDGTALSAAGALREIELSKLPLQRYRQRNHARLCG